jgi:hypothetical protein
MAIKRVLFAVAVSVPVFVLLSQSACKKEDAAAAGSGSASVVAASASSATLTALESAAPLDSAAPTADPDKLPTPAAHSTATAGISTATYKTDLDAIEKELNGIK